MKKGKIKYNQIVKVIFQKKMKLRKINTHKFARIKCYIVGNSKLAKMQ